MHVVFGSAAAYAEWHQPALQYATFCGYPSVARYLLLTGRDVKMEDNFFHLLGTACCKGDAELVTYLHACDQYNYYFIPHKVDNRMYSLRYVSKRYVTSEHTILNDTIKAGQFEIVKLLV